MRQELCRYFLESGALRKRSRALLFGIMLVCLASPVGGAEDKGSALTGPAPAPPGFSLLDAVEITLACDPNIQIAEQKVKHNEGSLRIVQGEFDATLSSSLSDGVTHTPLDEVDRQIYATDESVERVSAFSAGLTKKFRSGRSASLEGGVVRSDDLTTNSVGSALNRSSVTFTVLQPLFKGRGEGAPGEVERSAQLDVEVSRLTYRRVIDERVFLAVSAYWGYAAAFLSLEALKTSEASAGLSLDRVRRLIEAKEVPEADIYQVKASFEQYKAQRITGEQALFQARETLGSIIGLQPEEIVSLPDPSTSLNGFTAEAVGGLRSADDYAEMALARRPDVLAVRKAGDSALILFKAARKNLQPQLDLSLSAGYAGLDEGAKLRDTFSSFANNPSGLNVGGSLTYYWPIQSNSDRGRLMQRQADYSQKKLQGDDLSRNVRINIAVSVDAIHRGMEALRSQYAACEYYQSVLKTEKRKYDLGSSTLLDIIIYQDRLTAATLNRIASQQSVALAIARLRLETATITTPSDGAQRVTMENLLSAPKGE